jgi:hypothetical protein
MTLLLLYSEGPLPYRDLVLATPGLVGYWPLDEPSGSTAADAFASNDGTITGGVLGAAGIVPNTGDTSLYFDTTGDNVSIGAVNDFDSNHVSLEAWFKKDSSLFQFPDAPIAAYRAAGGAGGWVLQSRNPTTGYSWYVSPVGVGFQDVIANGLADDTVYHVVATYDGHRNRLYIDGVLVATGGSDLNAVIDQPANLQLMIGKAASATATHQGWISDVSLYDVALDAAMIEAHYEAGITPLPSVAVGDIDTVSPTLSEVETVVIAAASTETVSPTLAESETLAVSLAETDTISPTLSEAETISLLLAKSDTDTIVPTLTETESLAIGAADTETVAPTLTEAESLIIAATDTETISPVLSEADTVAATLADTDTVTPTATEADTVAATLVDTETVTPTLTEVDTAAVVLADTDTIAPTLSEAETIDQSSPRRLHRRWPRLRR